LQRLAVGEGKGGESVRAGEICAAERKCRAAAGKAVGRELAARRFFFQQFFFLELKLMDFGRNKR